MTKPSAEARLKRNVRADENGCWTWTAYVDEHGYGRMRFNGKWTHAHRVSFILFRRQIEDGLTVDHLCRNRACVNPNHLRAVTNRENCLAGVSPWAVYARRTHCAYGHELAGDNLGARKSGARLCRECARERNRRYAATAHGHALRIRQQRNRRALAAADKVEEGP